ncbi:MAG TPA: hypothetical protein VI895_06765 [Bdellovibrionota bacterium]|nr:hypothetical protein [Bdellovibrionota bacterium]
MADRDVQFKEVTRLSPDAKGRVTLGKFAKGVSSFRMNVDDEGRILLEPFVEIRAGEQWLFRNKEALARVKRGLEDSESGKTKSLGSFAKYAQDDEE